MITREYDGIAGAGGVKDVSMQLSEALAEAGKKVSVVMPLYGSMNPEQLGFKPLGLAFDVDMPYVGLERRERVTIWSRNGRVSIYLVDAQRYREKRSIYTYTAEEEAENLSNRQGDGHFDYFAMNVLLQKASIALMICLNEVPDIIHCQDGHTAILPAMIRETEGYRHFFRKTGFIVTIHNAGIGYHQEVGDLPFAQTICGLPTRTMINSLLHDYFDPFLAASPYSVMNTVSENYARELRETEDDVMTGWLGHELLKRGVRLVGVTNGINPEDFNPGKPKQLGIAAGFDPLSGDLAGKKKCRKELMKLINDRKLDRILQTGSIEDRPGQPLFTLVGRLTFQKGVDKLIGALDALLAMDTNFQVLLLGTGDKEIENSLIELTKKKKSSGRICVLFGYDPVLANKIYAAGDFFLIPSQYEPCGLTDYIAQLYGNIPIVHHVGGLVKVVDNETGFAYQDHNSAALMAAMQKALQIYRRSPDTIKKIQQKAVRHIHDNYTWKKVVEHYISLYQEALTLISTSEQI
ncbi:MAG: glycogen/starch synthase [Proteobacteria bacterium]|nr:glycogen/starch synthase [Pseudomonadota bacterium]MBU1708523.1 glycogen/starch synthase [Pseudomonadota bacterium]